MTIDMDNLFLILVFLAGFCAVLGAAAFAGDVIGKFQQARKVRRRMRQIRMRAKWLQ